MRPSHPSLSPVTGAPGKDEHHFTEEGTGATEGQADGWQTRDRNPRPLSPPSLLHAAAPQGQTSDSLTWGSLRWGRSSPTQKGLPDVPAAPLCLSLCPPPGVIPRHFPLILHLRPSQHVLRTVTISCSYRSMPSPHCKGGKAQPEDQAQYQELAALSALVLHGQHSPVRLPGCKVGQVLWRGETHVRAGGAPSQRAQEDGDRGRKTGEKGRRRGERK